MRRSSFSSAGAYGLGVLIAGGLCLGGAKTPQAFALWGGVGLCFILYQWWSDENGFLTELQRPGLMAALMLVLASQLFSLDPSQSLFRTTQLLFFILLWPALSTRIKEKQNERFFWGVLQAVAGLTIGVSLIQVALHNGYFYGLLPINPSFNGAWMASLSVVLLSRALQNQTRDGLWSGVLAVCLGGLVGIGSSRGALLGGGIGMLYVLDSKFSLKPTLLMGCALLLIGLCFPQTVLSRFHVNIDAHVKEYRPQIWKTAIEGALDKPLTGYGLDNFELAYARHDFPTNEQAVRFGRTTAFAHNEYLQIAAEMGWPAFGLLGFYVFTLGRRRFRKPLDVGIAPSAALLTLLTAALFNPIWHMPFLLFITLMWASLGETSNKAPSLTLSSVRMTTLRIGFALMLSFVALLMVWFSVRDRWAARGEWDRILAINPADAQAWKETAFQKSDPLEALPFFEAAIRYSPHQFYLREDYAAALEHSVEPEDLLRALSEYRTALDLAPHRATTMLAIGRLFYRHRDTPQALVWFHAAQRLEPAYWESDLWIARCLFLSGQTRQAIRLLKQLPARRERFLLDHAPTWASPTSAYERMILAYNPVVLQNELRRFRASLHSTEAN